jgi:predicted deacylase
MKEDNILRINNNDILPGTNQWINIAAGKLPIGQKVYVKAMVYHSKKPGPKILFMAGMHGDEINSVEIIRRAMNEGIFESLKKGSVIAISLMNVFGFLNFTRDLPDGKDVNRSFPGSASGSLASRLAHALSHLILPIIDYGVDFHTGSVMKYNYPHIRYNKNDEKSKQLSAIFNSPVAFEQVCIPKSLRKTAKDKKIPILVFEGGEALRLDEYSIQVALQGIKNLLINEKMIIGDPLQSNQAIFKRSLWIRASSAGLFNNFQNPGTYVHKGTVLGTINDPLNGRVITVKSRRDGFIVGLNYAAIINQGDALYHLTYDAY